MLSKSSKKIYNNTNEETARSLDQIGSNAATIINLRAAGTKRCVQSEQTHKFPRQGLFLNAEETNSKTNTSKKIK
jgi:hypothetical protein